MRVQVLFFGVVGWDDVVMTQVTTMGHGSLGPPWRTNHSAQNSGYPVANHKGPEDPIFGSTGTGQDPEL